MNPRLLTTQQNRCEKPVIQEFSWKKSAQIVLKEYGKRIMGIFFDKHISEELKRSFDVQIEISTIIKQVEDHRLQIEKQKEKLKL